MPRMAWSCRSRAAKLAICLPAISDAMREKPVKNSIRWESSSARRPGGMITGVTAKLPSGRHSITLVPP